MIAISGDEWPDELWLSDPQQTAVSDFQRVGLNYAPLTMSAFLVRQVTIY